MIHIGDSPQQYPEVFEVDTEAEEELEIDYFGRVLRVEEFQLSDAEQEEEDTSHQEEDDPLMLWWKDGCEHEEDCNLCVRAVQESFYESSSVYEKMEVILDSGADVSLIPLWLGKEGVPVKKKNDSGIRDAQGRKICKRKESNQLDYVQLEARSSQDARMLHRCECGQSFVGSRKATQEWLGDCQEG